MAYYLPDLPDVALGERTYNLIVNGATNGTRNEEYHAAAQQFHHAGVSQDLAERVLIPAAARDGLPEKECRDTIRSAYRQQRREPLKAGGNGYRHKIDEYKRVLKVAPIVVEPEHLPPYVQFGYARFLEMNFRPGEYVAFATRHKSDGKDIWTENVLERDDLIEKLTTGEKILSPGQQHYGGFVRVNPVKASLKTVGKHSTDKDVTDFRHVLVEWDEGSKEQQLANIRQIGLPVSTVVDSADRSLHAWVKVDAESEEQYKERAKTLYEFCSQGFGIQVDTKNGNLSRYSRLPDTYRIRYDKDNETDVLDENGQQIWDAQRLLLTDLPGKSWAEWSAGLRYDDGSETIGVDDLLEFDRDNDESSLIGNRWLCKGKMAVLQGPTGVGKSSLIMQWAIRLILGLAFFGIQPVQAMKVLLIQAENDRGDMAEAFQDMLDAMKIGADDVEKLRQGLVIVNEDSRTGGTFVKFLEAKIEEHKPDIVFVDPLLAYIGGDILKQEVASKFFRNEINPVLRRTETLLIWVHHISKPGGQANGQEKSAEQNKYAGLGSSELQNVCREVINLSEQSAGIFELSFTKRGGRLGITGEDGKPLRKFNIEHNSKGIVWGKCEGPQATANKKATKHLKQVEQVGKYIESKKTVDKDTLTTWAKGQDIGRDNAIAMAKALAQEKERKVRIYMYSDPEHKEKGVKPKVFSILPPADGKEAFIAHEEMPILDRIELHEAAEQMEELEKQQRELDLLSSIE